MDNQIYNQILAAVRKFTECEEEFGDAAQLRIDPANQVAGIIDDPDEDLPEFDYYLINDLIAPQTDGSFLPDLDVIKEIADSY